MPKKQLTIKKVSIKKSSKGSFITLQNEDNNWYTHFGKDGKQSDLIGKIGEGGKLNVAYEKKQNGEYTNRYISQYKVVEKGNVPEGTASSESNQEAIQKNFEAKQDSIVRQVALKAAVDLLIARDDINKKTSELATKFADDFYAWTVKEPEKKEEVLEPDSIEEPKEKEESTEDLDEDLSGLDDLDVDLDD